MSRYRYFKDEFNKMTELDRICPVCKTSKYTNKKYSKSFNIESLMKENGSANKFIRATQYTYVCPVCGSLWDGLPSSASECNTSEHKIFLRVSDLYLSNFKSDWYFMVAWVIIWFFIGVIAFISTL